MEKYSEYTISAAPAHLWSAIVGYDKNKEWLKQVPHERVLDMAVFAKWHISDDATFTKVNNQMLTSLQMTPEEVLQMAKANTAAKMDYKSLNEVLRFIMISSGMDEEFANAVMESGGAHMHVLSTKDGIDGAALIADPKVLKQIHEQVGDDFYILPSSIHEVLILPKSEVGRDTEGLKEMVTMINGTEVLLQDQLTDNVYEFDGKRLKLTGWIPVEERLPAPRVDVLVSFMDFGEDTSTFIDCLVDNNGRLTWSTYNGAADKVVAWMPLPEPYQG